MQFPPRSRWKTLATRVSSLGVVVVALSCLSGCDTLSARFRARDGVDMYHAGDFKGGGAKFEEAARLDPSLAVLRLNAGTAHLAHFRQVGGKSAEGQEAATKAIDSYKEYLKLKPADDRVKGALVQTFVETNRYEAALEFFRPAVDKKDVEALGVLATVATKCGKKDEAEKWHQKRIEAAPTKIDGYVAFGVFLWQELHDHADWPHDKRLQKAEMGIEALKKAIDLQPNAPNAYTYANLLHREIAATDPSEEGKKKHTEEANKFLKLASERQGKG